MTEWIAELILCLFCAGWAISVITTVLKAMDIIWDFDKRVERAAERALERMQTTQSTSPRPSAKP